MRSLSNKLVVVLFFVGTFSFAQDDPLVLVKESTVSFSLGAGASYGGFGTQTVIGKQGSGLLIGLGTLPGGGFGYNFGLQIVVEDMFYVNGGYGTFAFFQPLVGEKTRENSVNLSVGVLISLSPAKKTFINLGVGFIANHYEPNFPGEAWSLNPIHPTLGIVFRL